MKGICGVIVIGFITFLSHGQTLPKNLTVDFEPSFIKHSAITIEQNDKISFIRIVIYENDNKKRKYSVERTIVNSTDLVAMWSFLEIYKYKIKGNIDTVRVEKVFRHGDSTLAYVMSAGVDGIMVRGKYLNNERTQQFAFWSPSRESPNYALVKEILLILDNSLRNKKSKAYLKSLKSYF